MTMNKESVYVIWANGQLVAKSIRKYRNPLTPKLAFARFYATRENAQKTLDELRRDPNNTKHLKEAEVKAATLTLTMD
jgi:hypothetical protein